MPNVSGSRVNGSKLVMVENDAAKRYRLPGREVVELNRTRPSEGYRVLIKNGVNHALQIPVSFLLVISLSPIVINAVASYSTRREIMRDRPLAGDLLYEHRLLLLWIQFYSAARPCISLE